MHCLLRQIGLALFDGLGSAMSFSLEQSIYQSIGEALFLDYYHCCQTSFTFPINVILTLLDLTVSRVKSEKLTRAFFLRSVGAGACSWGS